MGLEVGFQWLLAKAEQYRQAQCVAEVLGGVALLTALEARQRREAATISPSSLRKCLAGMRCFSRTLYANVRSIVVPVQSLGHYKTKSRGSSIRRQPGTINYVHISIFSVVCVRRIFFLETSLCIAHFFIEDLFEV